MKGLLKVIYILLSIFVTIADLVEFLFVPAVFILVGILYHLPWKYYLITVGGYFVLMLVFELILRLIFKALDKKYASRFARKMEEIISRFSKYADNPPAKDN